jgi:hypothetical protein
MTGLTATPIAGDQVYTLDAVFTETTPVRLRVSAGFKGMLRRLFSASVLLNINRPPLADAGPDQRVALGKLVVLDGSASLDPEGVPLIYTWSLIGRPVGSSAVLAAANSARATFTADRPGDYFAQPIVSDGQLASAPDAVSITVIHTPPTVSLTAPDEGSVHTLPVTVTVTATATAPRSIRRSPGRLLPGNDPDRRQHGESLHHLLDADDGRQLHLTAKATDSAGGVTTSAARTVQAANRCQRQPHQPDRQPELHGTGERRAHGDGERHRRDGRQVEFFQGATLIGTRPRRRTPSPGTASRPAVTVSPPRRPTTAARRAAARRSRSRSLVRDRPSSTCTAIISARREWRPTKPMSSSGATCRPPSRSAWHCRKRTRMATDGRR